MAAVVTYHPDDGLAGRLAVLGPQADALVVIDNGSPDAPRIAAEAAATGGRLIANGANLGVAAALNQAARAAQQDGHAWLAMFDQDSLAPPGAIAALLALVAAHPARERIGVIVMSRRDVATGRDYHRPGDILDETADWRSVRTAITSGSLVRTDLVGRLGGLTNACSSTRKSTTSSACAPAPPAGWLSSRDAR